MIRIGIGYDLHRLAAGRELRLGGVHVPFPKGPVAHSDGDVLIHALIDALLGAAGLGDIGRLFPDTDPALEGVRGPVLLARTMARLRRAGFAVRQADCVVVAERPKLAGHVEAMRGVLAPLLGIGAGEIGIKAKTNEGTGLIGRGGAVACWAVALIERTGRKKE